jgi:hypothetical protein
VHSNEKHPPQRRKARKEILDQDAGDIRDAKTSEVGSQAGSWRLGVRHLLQTFFASFAPLRQVLPLQQ